MATIYVAPTGVSTAAGTIDDPLDLATGFAQWGSGDELVLLHQAGGGGTGGVYRGFSLNKSGPLTDATIRGDISGGARPVMRGDTIIPSQDWTEAVANARYTASVSSPVSQVVWNWDTNLTTPAKSYHIARHYGHLKPVGSTASVESTPGSWYHDGSTLHINPWPGAQKPTVGDTYAWCRKDYAIQITNGSDCIVMNLDFALYCEASGNPHGRAVSFVSSTNCTAKNMRCQDMGFHALVGTGTAVSGIRFDNIVVEGQHDNGTEVANPFVIAHTGGSGVDSNVGGTNLVFHDYPLLDGEQNPITSHDRNTIMLQTHGVTGVSFIDNIEWSNCFHIADYIPSQQSSANRLLAAATDTNAGGSIIFDDITTYPCIIRDSTYIGYGQDVSADTNTPVGNVLTNGRIACVRCIFDLRSSNLKNIDRSSWHIAETSAAGYYFENCVFIGNYASFRSGVFNIRGDNKLATIGCVYYDIGSGGLGVLGMGQFVRFTLPGTSSKWKARNCVFARLNSGRLVYDHAGDSVTAAMLDIQDCWYYNIDVNGGYVDRALALDSKAEWQASVDADDGGAVYDVDPQIVQGDMTITPTAGGALETRIAPFLANALPGLQGPNAGLYGPYQRPRNARVSGGTAIY